jgi:DNA adenine methylase
MTAPFLKWAGGKAKLAPLVVAQAPAKFRRYHEPFLGAGAVFFALTDARLLKNAALADANRDLIACFTAVRDEPARLIAALDRLDTSYRCLDVEGRRAFYYEQRGSEPEAPIDRAARFIFLNRTCYNGLYRVNRSGRFNVPHGRYANPRIVDLDGLRAASAALASATLQTIDFEEACNAARAGDFVYLDPPYQPLSPTARFTSYTPGAFTPVDQERLRDAFEALTRRGAAALLSNSAHGAIETLYAGRGFTFAEVPMSRSINSNAAHRAPIAEYLISNFKRPEVARRFPALPTLAFPNTRPGTSPIS